MARADLRLASAALPSGAAVVTQAVDGVVALDETLDLRGSRLVLTGITGFSGAGEITDSVGGGVLELDVLQTDRPAEQTMDFSGRLRLVKRGAGTLYLKYPQTYSGGTEIFAGVVSSKKYGGEAWKTYGNPPAVVVHAGGTFDTNGAYGFTPDHEIVLDGGCLHSRRQDNSRVHSFAPRVRLTANSTFSTLKDKTCHFAGEIDLAGHVLSVQLGSTNYWSGTALSRGIILLTGKGPLVVNAPEVDLGLAECRVGVPLVVDAGNLTVGDYVVNTADAGPTGSGRIFVRGRFVPNGAAFRSCTLLDGATLVLPREEALPWACANAAGGAVSFASGARITLDSQGRRLRAYDRVLAWAEAPENVSEIAFLLDERAHARGLCVGVGADGVAVLPRGFKISVR